MESHEIWLAAAALIFSGATLVLAYLKLGNKELKEKILELKRENVELERRHNIDINKLEHRVAKLTDYLNAKEEEVDRLTRQNLELLMERYNEQKGTN
jgi:hypothetical protein